MKLCPTCGLRYPDESAFCFIDADTLAAIAGPFGGGAVGGLFRLEDRFADGSLAQLHRATQRLVTRPCIVKLSRLPTAGERTDFVSALALARRITHANVAPILGGGLLAGTGDDAAAAFVAWPHSDAQPLAELLAQLQLDASQTAGLVLQLLAALGRIHDFGAIHGDLRPSNVLYHANGHLDVLDVGLGRTRSRDPWEPAPEALAGQHYLAPELSAEVPRSGAGDLYSVGVMAFEMLAGRKPATGSDAASLCGAAARGAAAASALSLETAPPELRRWLAQLLAASPDERPAGADDAVTLLEDACRSDAVMPMLDAGRPAGDAGRLDPVFARWQRFVPVLGKLVQAGFGATVPEHAHASLELIRERAAQLGDLAVRAQNDCDALAQAQARAAEARERTALKFAAIREEAARHRGGLAELRASAVAGALACRSFEVEALAMRRELLVIEARAALVAPHPELAQAHRALAELVDRWCVTASDGRAADAELRRAEREVIAILEKKEALAPTVRVHESNAAEEIAAAEREVAATGDAADRIEIELSGLASRLCAPLRAKPELGAMFRDLKAS